MGNICRSPAGEIVFRKLVKDAGLSDQIEIDSAGTIGFHAGNPPDSRMSETLRHRGYSIVGKSRQIQPGDLDAFDLILVADRENLRDVRSLAPDGANLDHVQRLTDYCTDHDADHVPDPYYGGSSGFEKVADLVEDACQGLLDSINLKISKP
jgi:protein-tyrosine phosphatase